MSTDIYKVASTEQNLVRFCINGKEYLVSNDGTYSPEYKLVDFIRIKAGLTGTKYMCREGGCGACIVTVRVRDSKTSNSVVKAINSCLIPVFACDGWAISTIESLGNVKDGLHPLQKRIVDYNGTQCGFCTPGMVMSMHSLMKSKSSVSVQDVGDCLDGNICRCTGYRPILEAFKSFATDAPSQILNKCSDIEDYIGCHKIRGENTDEICRGYPKPGAPLHIVLPNGRKWIKTTTLKETYHEYMKSKSSGKSIRIVAGNTGQGVYRSPEVNSYLDISDVAELTKYSVDKNEIVLGSCLTLAKVMELFKTYAKLDGYQYTMQIRKHMQRVANPAVRNVGTLGGNLMLKHRHKEFPSDMFMLMATIDAKVEMGIISHKIFPNTVFFNMKDFLRMDMEGKCLISVRIPTIMNVNTYFRSFKITKRYQNCHAYVNAGILMRVDPAQNFKVIGRPRIVYQGINPDFVNASNTESFLANKSLLDQNTLTGAMNKLEQEVNPDSAPEDASPSYRKQLTKSLLYKTILGIIEENADGKVRSGSIDIVRPVSSGKQTFDKDNGSSPLFKPTIKLEAPVQATGEAEYINDIPILPNELFGAFVLTEVGKAEIVSIDATEALKMDGVFRFITAKDIPGVNNFYVFGFYPVKTVEQIFQTNYSIAAGLPVGLMLADSREKAYYAASKVVVYYGKKQKVHTSGLEVLQQAERDGTVDNYVTRTATSKRKSKEMATRTIKGTHFVGSQYHFSMELQTVLCVPKEDCMEVYSSTQWMDHVQSMIASAINLPTNYINVYTKRLGGAFGAKLTKATLVATAGAVSAYVTNRPVRIDLGLETNMKMIGKRSPYVSRYEVKVDERGKIVELNTLFLADYGFSSNDSEVSDLAEFVQSVYVADGWEIKMGNLTTDLPANTFTRAPGLPNAIALIETIMERIAFELKKDPLDVRAVNFAQSGDLKIDTGEPFIGENLIPKILNEIKKSSDYEKRKRAVQKFNDENRWKKRGIAVCPTKYYVHYTDAVFSFYITAYHYDGSIAASYGGIEMGQGINTKVAQTVAHILEVSLQKIKIKSSSTLTGTNSFATSGSRGSELCCYAAMRACQVLKERLRPIKEELGPNATWEEIVTEAHTRGIDLSATHTYTYVDGVEPYSFLGAAVSEVEIDVLTGEHRIMRLDLLQDVGKSLNPNVDVGQIEGAVLMAIGLWTTEELIFNKNTGELLTNRTWASCVTFRKNTQIYEKNYQPPESKDVPTDLRVTLLHDNPNPFGVLGSKAVAEPAMVGMVSVFFALKNAIDAARKDAGNSEWFQFDSPATPENILGNSLSDSSNFIL